VASAAQRVADFDPVLTAPLRLSLCARTRHSCGLLASLRRAALLVVVHKGSGPLLGEVATSSTSRPAPSSQQEISRTKMASFSTLSLPHPLRPMKYIPYVPLAPKPKTKSKANVKAKPKTTKRKLYEDGSHGYEGDWANIDDFPTDMSGPNPGPSAAAGAASPSGSLHLGIPAP
jgi:hypothetical protein